MSVNLEDLAQRPLCGTQATPPSDTTGSECETDSSYELLASSHVNGNGDEGYATMQKPVTQAGTKRGVKDVDEATKDTDERRSDEPVKLSFEKGKQYSLN